MHPQPQESSDADPSSALEAASAFARTRLGPASERLVAAPGTKAILLSRMRGGAEPCDAVLAEVHRAAKADRDLANEFLAHFIPDLQKLGHPMVSRGLRRFLDTWDLAQSVLGHVWIDFDRLEFTDRVSFLSLLSQKLRWKAVDRTRKAQAFQAREQARALDGDAEGGTPAPTPSPATELGTKEDAERLVLALLRLQPRDRDLLRMQLRGASQHEMTSAFGLSADSLSRALRRAQQHARALLSTKGEAH